MAAAVPVSRKVESATVTPLHECVLQLLPLPQPSYYNSVEWLMDTANLPPQCAISSRQCNIKHRN